MKVHWATGEVDKYGNQYGFHVHNRESRKALAAAGVELTEDADISVYVATPLIFRPPDDGRMHVLYTAWDSTSLPSASKEALGNADAIICSSSYMVPTMRTVAKPGTPIYVCSEGVDYEKFKFTRKRRSLRKVERMRALWLGAPNQRKGYPWVLAVADEFNKNGLPVDFYMKTTTAEEEKRFRVKGRLPGTRTIYDSRRVSDEELVRLYHEAHVFLFPTMGEGFGLTLAEAMASGLPCIYTPWSGVTDFCDGSVAYPLKFEVKMEQMGPGSIPEDHPQYAELSTVGEVAYPDPTDLCEKLFHVMTHYKEAVVKGEAAARRIRDGFTWKRTGERLKEILEDLQAKRGEADGGLS